MNAEEAARLAWLEPAPENFRDLLGAALAAQDVAGLRRLAGCALNDAQLSALGRGLAKVRDDVGHGLASFRLAVLSNATAEHLGPLLVASALRYGVALEVMSFSYHEAYAVAVGGDARLLAFAPQAVLVAWDYRGLPWRETYGDVEGERRVVEDCCAYLQAMFVGARKLGATLIVQSLARPARRDFGHADAKIAGSLARVLDEVNRFVAATDAVLLDVAALAGELGAAQWFDARAAHLWKMPFAVKFAPLYADHVARLVGAMLGKSRRVLVLDLDNTLWGGVVGDEGVEGLQIGNGTSAGEAFLEFQQRVLALRQRGVLLAVASKNDAEQALRPFRELPAMVLKEDSFAAFHANWDDKAANIRAMAEALALGLESFVFVDDNPMERALVRRFLPEVAVPELPEDPAGYADVLDAAGYFEAVAFSDEDARRAQLYQARSALARVAPHDLGSYLQSLAMKLYVAPVGAANLARATQLVNKSNQFNLTTRRYTEAEVTALAADPRFVTFTLRLVDNLADNGLISVVFCEKRGDALDVVLWVMSCRVIKRRVEEAVRDVLARRARELGCARVTGTYIPTARNNMVARHYADLGFVLAQEEDGGVTRWVLDLATAAALEAPLEIVAEGQALRAAG